MYGPLCEGAPTKRVGERGLQESETLNLRESLSLSHLRGQLLYREALYERVWGLDSDAGPRTVDIHIHRLRKKLHWDDKIVTVPKVGYKLMPQP